MVLVSGCAGAQLEKEMKDSRGYSDADVTEIKAAAKDYRTKMTMASFRTNRFTSSAEDRNHDDMKVIFCKCWKEMKSKCREKSDGLTADQHALWLKSNAVDFAIISMESPGSVSNKIDPDTCS